ncbi:hypothetical protein VFPPC_14984 [Pochonia chlamydosporia 170]|uniref:BHLH domain-containing protein n=1 Tax=Pochonia chlamydosporia 170 TaxID=1380566 RepID=A0A179F1B2_METCM|nr:hypothetical protein VFPPC_14984 [Pochonia chlamydosporia 170]OAQ59040.1 hypothetical protein VFPPC_14984 [Pochonia chlamydosporia 170]
MESSGIWPAAGRLPYGSHPDPMTPEIHPANTCMAINDLPTSLFDGYTPLPMQTETDVSYWLQQCGPAGPEPHDETFAFTGAQSLFRDVDWKVANPDPNYSNPKQKGKYKNSAARKDGGKRDEIQNLFDKLAGKVSPGRSGMTRKEILLASLKHVESLESRLAAQPESQPRKVLFVSPACLSNAASEPEPSVHFATQSCEEAAASGSQGCLGNGLTSSWPTQEQCPEVGAAAALVGLFCSPKDNKSNDRGLAIQDLIT